MGGVCGIDSAVPVRYEDFLTPMSTDAEIGPRAPDWFEKGKLTGFGIENVRNVRGWLNVQGVD
jgi:hypothetical protein